MYQHSKVTQEAKSFLKANRAPLIVAALIISMVNGAFQVVNRIGSSSVDDETAAGVLGIIAILGLLGTAYSAIIVPVMGVGGQGWFLQAIRGNIKPVGSLFDSFRNGNFGRSWSTMFLVSLYTTLWSMLFVVPGIIKGLSYSMAGYIINDNPTISADDAIKLSMRMTDGHKGDLFYLYLTIIGWNLLGIFTLGILNIYFSIPYSHTVMAKAYEELKIEAVAMGKASPYEFGD